MKNTQINTITLFFLLISAISTQAGRPLDEQGVFVQALELVEQSWPVWQYTHYLASKNIPNPQAPLIPEHTRERIKQAQMRAGIPLHRHVAIDQLEYDTPAKGDDTSAEQPEKIKVIKLILSRADVIAWAWKFGQSSTSTSPSAEQSSNQNLEAPIPVTMASASPGLISLHPDFEKYPHHKKERVVNHEVDHIRCNGQAMHDIIKKIPLLRSFLFPRYHRFCEQRADIKGAYASQCWCCVTLDAQTTASHKIRTDYFAKAAQVQETLQAANEQEKVQALFEYARDHSPQVWNNMKDLLKDEAKINMAHGFFKNAITIINDNTESLTKTWNTYVQREGFHIIAGQLLKENEQNICKYHTTKMEQNPEFKQEMLAAKPVLTAALQDYYTQQEKTLANRSKKLVNKSALLAHTGALLVTQASKSALKQAAQPRTALPATLLKINKPLI